MAVTHKDLGRERVSHGTSMPRESWMVCRGGREERERETESERGRARKKRKKRERDMKRIFLESREAGAED